MSRGDSPPARSFVSLVGKLERKVAKLDREKPILIFTSTLALCGPRLGKCDAVCDMKRRWIEVIRHGDF